jgi:hypothetical protein
VIGDAIGNEGIRAIAASPHLAGLEELVLVSNEMGRAGARALAESPHLQRLQSLVIKSQIYCDKRSFELLQNRFGVALRAKTNLC